MDPATARAVEATARATDKALNIIHDTGGYLREVIGELPKNAVGLLGGDWLGEKRRRNLDAMMRRTVVILRERDSQAIDQLSPNIATELLSGAQEESRDDLIELWARLLANALDPKLGGVRHSYIDAVKRMDPPDAVVLNFLHARGCQQINLGGGSSGTSLGTHDIALQINVNQDGVQASIEHLTELGLLIKIDGGNRWYFTANGREFIRACYPEGASS
jgi:abortive infection alpha-like protein